METSGIQAYKCMICGWGTFIKDDEYPPVYCPIRYCRAMLFENHDNTGLKWQLDEDES